MVLRTIDAKRRTAALAVATVMVAGLIPASVVAQQEETYYGCLTPESLLVDVGIGEAPAGHCAETDTLIDWNAVGPAGPQGDARSRGREGRHGRAGRQG